MNGTTILIDAIAKSIEKDPLLWMMIFAFFVLNNVIPALKKR